MNRTLGAPSAARTGAGQAGLDSSSPANHTGKRRSGLILDDGHQKASMVVCDAMLGRKQASRPATQYSRLDISPASVAPPIEIRSKPRGRAGASFVPREVIAPTLWRWFWPNLAGLPGRAWEARGSGPPRFRASRLITALDTQRRLRSVGIRAGLRRMARVKDSEPPCTANRLAAARETDLSGQRKPCPSRAFSKRATGFEPATLSLGGCIVGFRAVLVCFCPLPPIPLSMLLCRLYRGRNTKTV